MTSKKKLKARIRALEQTQALAVEQQGSMWSHIESLRGTVTDIRMLLMASPEKRAEILHLWREVDGALTKVLRTVEDTVLFGDASLQRDPAGKGIQEPPVPPIVRPEDCRHLLTCPANSHFVHKGPCNCGGSL